VTAIKTASDAVELTNVPAPLRVLRCRVLLTAAERHERRNDRP